MISVIPERPGVTHRSPWLHPGMSTATEEEQERNSQAPKVTGANRRLLSSTSRSLPTETEGLLRLLIRIAVTLESKPKRGFS